MQQDQYLRHVQPLTSTFSRMNQMMGLQGSTVQWTSISRWTTEHMMRIALNGGTLPALCKVLAANNMVIS